MPIKYQKSDFQRVTWDEYGELLEVLYEKVKTYLTENKVTVNGIVPILRSGAFPGTFLAHKLHILSVIPMQYKYMSGEVLGLKKLLDCSDKIQNLPDAPTLLVVENNHATGKTAIKVIDDMKEKFPNANILYATVCMDYSHQEVKNTDAVFYAKLTNETRELSQEKLLEKGLSNNLALFPWEDLDEELAMVNEQGFSYF